MTVTKHAQLLQTQTNNSRTALYCVTWYCTVSCIAPRWTGICGALATKPPSGPNRAQEKSNLSYNNITACIKVHSQIIHVCIRTLIFVDMAVLCKTLLMSSIQIKMKCILMPHSLCTLIQKHILLPSHLFSNAHKTMWKDGQLYGIQFHSNYTGGWLVINLTIDRDIQMCKFDKWKSHTAEETYIL